MIQFMFSFAMLLITCALSFFLLQYWTRKQTQAQNSARQQFDEYQIKGLKMIQEALQQGMLEVRRQVTETITHQNQQIDKNFSHLTETVQSYLKAMTKEVDQQLSKGFEKNTQTFTNVIQRLTIIDEAQKKISELSHSVISLKEILADKKARGAFGEVQLSALIHNMVPEGHFSMQHTLSNGKRPDCFLLLPQPTGNIAIDAKFPLEAFQKLMGPDLNPTERIHFEQRLKADMKHHIKSISEKYIISNETADGAILFLPAESIFAEIHAHYPEVIEYAYQERVWIVSPTTLMAILTTARAVLKDEATRKQVHIIQEHLGALSKDFSRFQERMDHLSRHIHQAREDVEAVHKSSQKISSRFNKIEKVELSNWHDLPA